jgi:hypothetical protein
VAHVFCLDDAKALVDAGLKKGPTAFATSLSTTH